MGIWLAGQAHAAPLPPVFFDHMWVKVSDSTYEALRESEWLRNSGELFFEADKKVSTWEGHYIQGMRGYLEIFSRSKLESNPYLGSFVAGLGLYNESESKISDIHQALQSLAPIWNFQLYENFFSWNTYAQAEGLALWVAEIKPDFMGSHDLSRRNWLATLRKRVGVEKPPRMDEFREATVELGSRDLSLLDATLGTLGYAKESLASGGASYVGPNGKIVALPAAKSRGLTRAVFSLDAQPERSETRRVGDIEIEVRTDTSTLSFRFHE